jgi:hypothetical protein
MIDALIKRVSVSYKGFEMYAHRGKKVQRLVFCDRSRIGRPLINYRHFLRRSSTILADNATLNNIKEILTII